MVERGNARMIRMATYVGAGLVLILGVFFVGVFFRDPSPQWPDTLPVRVGQSLQEVKKALGEPTASYRLANEQTNTILRYCKDGLTVGINDTKGLYFIDVREPWSRPILGISLGEPMSEVMESTKIHRGETSIMLQGHPNWFLYTSSMADPSKYWCLEAEARRKALLEEAQEHGLESPLVNEPQAQPKDETVARISFHDWTRRR